MCKGHPFNTTKNTHAHHNGGLCVKRVLYLWSDHLFLRHAETSRVTTQIYGSSVIKEVKTKQTHG